jgi:hypothetical protein
MTRSSPASLLQALADDGLRAVPADRFEEVAEECDARARETGDARYPVLHQVLLQANSWWDERGGVPKAIADEVDAVIRSQLPGALAEPSSREGYARAMDLANGLRALMTGLNNWVDRGYLKPPPESE